MSNPLRAPFPDSTDNLGEEVDYGGSDGQSPCSPGQKESTSGNSSPTVHQGCTLVASEMTQDEPNWHPTKGVILVSEAFTEINAGLVIVLQSPKLTW